MKSHAYVGETRRYVGTFPCEICGEEFTNANHNLHSQNTEVDSVSEQYEKFLASFNSLSEQYTKVEDELRAWGELRNAFILDRASELVSTLKENGLMQVFNQRYSDKFHPVTLDEILEHGVGHIELGLFSFSLGYPNMVNYAQHGTVRTTDYPLEIFNHGKLFDELKNFKVDDKQGELFDKLNAELKQLETRKQEIHKQLEKK